ncbi:alpha/beta fold hydrolase [Phaeacidiphilus oryzae]|uniref:alpha/beta fold hydrolase n=1 Tax=Phaeacidiphilus oryzae TaxID=348818 RepID=UPI000A06D3AF
MRAAAEAVVDDVAQGRWALAGRRAGWLGVSVGVVAAGAAAGVAVERLTTGRVMRQRARAELDAAAPFGSLRGEVHTVAAEDGTELHVEVDEPTAFELAVGPVLGPVPGSAAGGAEAAGEAAREAAEPLPRRATARLAGALRRPVAALRRLTGGAEPPTVVFCHGYALNLDSWHFQRAALRDTHRLVLWDQRSHGRSERSRSHLAGEPAAIDQLGRDLRAVLDAVAPTGPLVLVGHSMGGMTVLSLARQYPELFRDRVAGVALIGTSSGDLAGTTFGLPAAGAKVFHRIAPGVLRALGKQSALVERGRRIGAELAAPFYRKYSFGSPDVDPAVARFAERMLDGTPIDVVAEFFPAIAAYDERAALPVLRGLPVLVLTGTRDLLTPPGHAEVIAAELPEAELVLVEDAGHLVMLERPDVVDELLSELILGTRGLRPAARADEDGRAAAAAEADEAAGADTDAEPPASEA